MDQLFNEIRAAVANNAWVLALFGVLAVPDICAALESPDGTTSGAKYKAWITANLGDKYACLDAGEIYKMRCSMLHEGASATANYKRTIFVASGSNTFHMNILGDALNLDLKTFAEDVITAASRWLSANKDTEPVKTNLEKLIRWYPNGLPGYFANIPVLA